MLVRTFIDVLSKWAPAVVVASLIASVAGAWASASDRLINSLAFVVGTLALVLLIARGMRGQFSSKEELGFTRMRDLISYAFFGKGIPSGSYPLAALVMVTGIMTRVQSANGWLVCSSFALTIAWIKANERYPADPTSR